MHQDTTRILADNHRTFLRFLEKRVGSRPVAEDILQEAFVRSLDRGDSLQNEESVLAWFYRMLRNAVVDHYRRRGASERALARFAEDLEAEPPADPELQAEVCACVARLADTLKPEYADVLKRVEVDGLPVKDYAGERGITSNNAAVRVFRAREALRQKVRVSCGTCAEHGCLNCTCAPSAPALENASPRAGHCSGKG